MTPTELREKAAICERWSAGRRRAMTPDKMRTWATNAFEQADQWWYKQFVLAVADLAEEVKALGEPEDMKESTNMPNTPDTAPKEMTAEERADTYIRKWTMGTLFGGFGELVSVIRAHAEQEVKAETERCCKLMCHWCDVDEPAERTEFGWYHFGGVTDCAAAAIREGEKGE